MATVYITCPEEAADELAGTLVEERLAACVNAVACHSTYRWAGDIVEEPEVVLLCKTTDDRYRAVCDRVIELHPHDVPCIERFDEVDVLDAYADWVEESTRPEGP